ncbi:MAG TPA: single-stranded-DNA-specific exonuclease RecJ [Candidatus Limiplasma sp.]|nr:single-stranded-DNA-specific exonuclease RecJ [Candidatus Limiplasma sp.]
MLRFVKRSDRVFSEKQKVKLRPYTGVKAALLFSRGLETAADADRFLHPDMDQLHDPFLLSGMRKAVDLIAEARQLKQRVVVYGDYDTDGVCAASLLTEALRAYGVEADAYLPLRDDGYGLNKEAVEQLSKTYQLLVTVDLGISNAAEVALAQTLGMKVVVTDHHQLSLTPCPADAVINPLMDGYPFAYLCGAGVAYKLATALHPADDTLLARLLPLAAVATIADIVSLTGENRVIAALGLPLLQTRLGLKALLEVAGVKPPVLEGAVAYQIAPRLNAAGRVADANAAVKLLMTDDPMEAQRLAQALDAANTERKRLEAAAVDEAAAQAKTHNFVKNHVLFVRGEGWHKGVLGLTAGRLNRMYSVPVCALSEEDGVLHGSLRGVAGVNLAACLKQCDDLLVKYGGHEMAAGVTLETAQYEAFQARLEAAVSDSADADAFIPAQEYDLALELEDAELELVDLLDGLRPFGAGNPAPVFLTAGARVETRRACGAGGTHLQLRLRQNKKILSGIAFGKGGDADTLPDEVDAAYTLERNAYMGRVEVQCHVAALRPSGYMRRRTVEQESDAVYQDWLIERLAEQAGKTASDAEKLTFVPEQANATADSDALLDGCQGTLYVAYTRDTAVALLQKLEDRVDVWVGAVEDPRCFHTLLLRPGLERLSPHWKHVVLLDGALSDADLRWWQEQCPSARLVAPAPGTVLRRAMQALDAGDDAYRELYKLLRRTTFESQARAAQAAGLTQAQTLLGLLAFAELGFIRLARNPFQYELLQTAKRPLDDSPLLHHIRTIATGKEGHGC